MKSRKAALCMTVILSILWSSRYTRAAECYEGTKTFERVEVERPYCRFTIMYSNSDCEKRPWISLEAADDWSYLEFQKPACYHRRYEVTCFCYGHLCNEGSSIKEHDDRENAIVKSPTKNIKTVQEKQEKGGTKLTTYIVFGGAALLVIVVLLSLILALLAVLISRKKARADEDDEDSKNSAESLRTPHDCDRLEAAKEGGRGHRVTFSAPPEKRDWDRSKSSTWEADSVRREDHTASGRFDEKQSTSEDDSR